MRRQDGDIKFGVVWRVGVLLLLPHPGALRAQWEVKDSPYHGPDRADTLLPMSLIKVIGSNVQADFCSTYPS